MLFRLVLAMGDWVLIYKCQETPSGNQRERVFFLSAFDVLGGEATLARVTACLYNSHVWNTLILWQAHISVTPFLGHR
jgi:hypothetical protein